MSLVFLGLGSNLGNRRENLESALRAIRQLPETSAMRVSSVYETPPLLPQGAPPEWNKSFWNLAVEIHFSGSPHEALRAFQGIEHQLGRTREERWAPRTVDIDILSWEGITLADEALAIPHPRSLERAFVLDPLAELAPTLILRPSTQTVTELARKHPQHSARLMGIINLTPDSFSDGGKYLSLEPLSRALDGWDQLPVPILDLGGESTRPGASAVDSNEEWQRIAPVLAFIRDRYQGQNIRPQVSVDTRKADIAAKAIEHGADLINNVAGLPDPQMMDVFKSSACEIVLMHSLSVPADLGNTLAREDSAVDSVRGWMERALEVFYKAGINQARIILDPGIGFGKMATQSLQLMADLKRIQSLGCTVLVGHSRKSFLGGLCGGRADSRDPETLGVSISLVEKGVDIIRVHDPVLHHRAMMGWRSIR